MKNVYTKTEKLLGKKTKFGDAVNFLTSLLQQVEIKDKQQVFQVPILMLGKGSLPNFTFPIKQVPLEIFRKPRFSDNFKEIKVLEFQSEENLRDLLELYCTDTISYMFY